jgi:hypothetical protein
MYEKLRILYLDGAHIVPANAAAILHRLYDALGALDQTSAAILTFDAILITAAVFSAQGVDRSSVERHLAQTVIAVALVSAVLALLVDRVSYPFLGKVVITPEPGLDFTQEFATLDGEIARRTMLYRSAWSLSLAAVIGFLVYIIAWTVRSLRKPSPPPIEKTGPRPHSGSLKQE